MENLYKASIHHIILKLNSKNDENDVKNIVKKVQSWTSLMPDLKSNLEIFDSIESTGIAI